MEKYIKNILDEKDFRHKKEFNDKKFINDIKNNFIQDKGERNIVDKIGKEIFKTGVHYGRIMVFLFFVRLYCEHLKAENKEEAYVKAKLNAFHCINYFINEKDFLEMMTTNKNNITYHKKLKTVLFSLLGIGLLYCLFCLK